MKKKFLSLALAAVMALGTAFAFTGCDFSFGGSNDNDDSGSGNGGGSGGGSGSQGEQGEQIDSALNEFLVNVTEADFTDMAMSFDVTDFYYIKDGEPISQGAWQSEREYSHIDEDGITADIYTNISSNFGGSDNFAMIFLRKDHSYDIDGSWKELGINSGNYNAVLQKYKNDGPNGKLYCNRSVMFGEDAETVGGIMQQIPTSLIAKLVGNLPRLFGGATTETVENGYTVTYNVVNALQDLVKKAYDYLGTVGETTTVNEILNSSFIKDILTKLFYGISANDVLGVVENFLPSGTLPAAPTGQSVYDYIKALANDKALYGTFMEKGLKDAPDAPKAQTFGEWTLYDIFYIFGSVQPQAGTVAQMIEMVRAMLLPYSYDFVGAILGPIFGSIEGDSTAPLHFETHTDFKFVLQFDEDKNFTGFSCNGFFDAYSSERDVNVRGNVDYTIDLSSDYTYKDIAGIKYIDSDYNTEKLDLSDLPSDRNMSFTLEGEEPTRVNYTLSCEATETTATITLTFPDGLTDSVTLNVVELSESLEWYKEVPFEGHGFTYTVNGTEYKVTLKLVVSKTHNSLRVQPELITDPEIEGTEKGYVMYLDYVRESGVIPTL